MDSLITIVVLGSLVFLVMGIISLIKKNKKAKRNFGIFLGLFVAFIVLVNITQPATETSSESDNVKEVKASESEKETEEQERADETEAEPEKEADPASVVDVEEAVLAGMSDEKFKEAKEKLNADHTKSISIGNGNVGYVIKATDGFVVASTDGERITDVNSFTTMDEVNAFGEESVAASEAKAKEEAKELREQSKTTLSGSGNTASDGIELEAGWAVFDASHKSGSSNFAVELQDESGQTLELLVNTIGTYEGKTFAQIPSQGTYYLNITADGSWNFDIHQTPPVDIKDVPGELSGSGDDVVFINAESGNHKFSFSHSGQSNFAVLVNGQALLANEIGNYEGSTREALPDTGMYAIVVNADGDWTINIE
ncbi:hypothetical protein [Halobacillus salinus]|uniref:Uncharacterized protein n=1 Tax=Halobacillus salinus TaxID=192814 RepID=A0A4Z0H2Q8_9BACI|nr:hypothetical protein [Halobacillus salinus]TGB04673.1 hypothetical protein E4663_06690 [Halobacillus salinus]